MFVRFVKDNKKFKKNTIIKCNALHGALLINKGLAVQEQKCYKIKDLYVAQLISLNNSGVLGVYDNNPLDYSIFYFNPNSSIFGDGQERGYFKHVLTGEEYLPSNHKDNHFFTKGMKVIRRESLIHYSTFFYADMHARGLTEDSYVSVSDLVYNEYKARTKMQNIKNRTKQDDGIDYSY